jgi:chemotaxis regulatin CheY-phosphate phosphatase CheZ
MTTTSAPLSKADELRELRAFIDSRPGTYLADILADSFDTIAGMLADDITCGLGDELRELTRQIINAREQLRELVREANQAEQRAVDANRRSTKARDELDSIRAAAISLARCS